MKKTSIRCLFIAVIAMVAVAMAAAGDGRTMGAEDKAPPAFPVLSFESCIQATRSVMRNPFTHFKNDMLIITKYEEYTDADHLTGSDNEGINAILVTGVYFDGQRSALLIHSIALVVEKVRFDDAAHVQPVYRHWLLMDTDGNGKLDKAVYGEGPKSIVQGSFELPKTAVPLKLTAELQHDFENAVNNLAAKAESKTNQTCLVI